MSISRRLSRALTRRKATKMVNDQRVHSNEWAELDKAQKTLNQNLKLAKPRVSLIVEQTIDAMTRKSSMAAKIKNAESAEEKARLHWRKIFNLVIEKQNTKKNQTFVGLSTIGGMKIEEEDDGVSDVSSILIAHS